MSDIPLGRLRKYYAPGMARFDGVCGICGEAYRDRYVHLIERHHWAPEGTVFNTNTCGLCAAGVVHTSCEPAAL